MSKQILYIDMDGVLVDFESGLNRMSREYLEEFVGRYDEIPMIFSAMSPMKDAVESFKILAEHYDTYILSTAPWENEAAWTSKIRWVKDHLGQEAHKRLILTHNKNLNRGHFLIDDRTKNGAGEFEGTLIKFGTERFPNWKSVVTFLTE